MLFLKSMRVPVPLLDKSLSLLRPRAKASQATRRPSRLGGFWHPLSLSKVIPVAAVLFLERTTNSGSPSSSFSSSCRLSLSVPHQSQCWQDSSSPLWLRREPSFPIAPRLKFFVI